jgi:DNA/RNA-binding domain of Phe-tRNA-synthetase-like protein
MPVDRRSRPQRWRNAVAELLTLQTEYAAWLAALPDSLQDTPMAEALQAIVELDLDTLASTEPPRGYGRD